MTQFNPLYGSILQAPAVQQRQSAEKVSQVRREQVLQKNVAAQDDQLEHQVESSEELQQAKEQRDQQNRRRKQQQQQRHEGLRTDEDGQEHVDLTA